MPPQVFGQHNVQVQTGHKGPQNGLAPGFVSSSVNVPTEPVIGEDDGVIWFESKNPRFRLQLNTPKERFDQVTGRSVKDENKFIQFDKCRFGATKKEEVEAIMASRYFGAPGQGLIWRMKERQRQDITEAAVALGIKMQANPDLALEVAAVLRQNPALSGLFVLPAREAVDPGIDPSGAGQVSTEGGM